MLEITNVTKRFLTTTALYDISFSIPDGAVVGLLGPNGAGKTTLMHLIMGMIQPDSGRIIPKNHEWPTIGYKPDRVLFPNHLTIKQYLLTVAQLTHIPAKEQENTVLDLLSAVGLLSEKEKQISGCSKGMRQRISFAQSLLGSPSLLILDEPSNGLDPEWQLELQQLIQELHAAGKTILISSHNLEEITAVCTHIAIIVAGQLRYFNTMRDAQNLKPHIDIQVDKPVADFAPILQAFHPHIEIKNTTIKLYQDAIPLKTKILGLLLSTGFDLIQLKHTHVSLRELYQEAVKTESRS